MTSEMMAISITVRHRIADASCGMFGRELTNGQLGQMSSSERFELMNVLMNRLFRVYQLPVMLMGCDNFA